MNGNRKLIYIVIGIVVFIAWSGAAGEWDDKECTLSQGYGYVITHGGGPDEHEGCREYFGDTSYTDDYRG